MAPSSLLSSDNSYFAFTSPPQYHGNDSPIYNDTLYDVMYDSPPYTDDLGGPMMPGNDFKSLQVAVRAINLHVSPLVAGLGIVGNVFCAVILMLGEHTKNLSTTQYIFGILVTDIISLMLELHRWLGDHEIHFFIIGGWCQLITFLTKCTDFLSAWYLVAACVDRFLGTFFEDLDTNFCTPCKARVVIIALTMVCVTVFLNISLMYGLLVFQRPICTTLPQFVPTVLKLDHIDVFLNGLLPLCMVFILIILVICRVCYRCRGDIRWKLRMGPRGLCSNNGSRVHVVDYDDEMIPTYSTLWFALIILLLAIPLQAFRVKLTVSAIRFPNKRPALDLFLKQQILQFLKTLRQALNVAIVLGCNASVRHSVRSLTVSKCHTSATSSRPSRRNRRLLCDSEDSRKGAMQPRVLFSATSREDMSVTEIISHELV